MQYPDKHILQPTNVPEISVSHAQRQAKEAEKCKGRRRHAKVDRCKYQHGRQ